MFVFLDADDGSDPSKLVVVADVEVRWVSLLRLFCHGRRDGYFLGGGRSFQTDWDRYYFSGLGYV
jgi:hypothetical protein